MKQHIRLLWFTGLLLVFPLFHTQAQNNLIVNGDFTGTSGWNDLGLYSNGQATGAIVNGAYVITIAAPGTEVWGIQFTQSHITLDSGVAYAFSYELSCSINRTVEVSLSRDGGDYMSYSGRDTVQITSEGKKFEKLFVMKQPTDTNVRLEFNCGKAMGTITLRNVKLVKYTSKILTIKKPQAGELVYAGLPYTVTWSSLNIDSTLTVEVSVDNGSTWYTVGVVNANAGSYSWLPKPDYSPWCRIRLTSNKYAEILAVNEGAFELAPGIDLVKNGLFDEGDLHWFFGKYGGVASGGVSAEGEYHVTIDTSAPEPWQIQLTQNGINLVKGARYRLTFIAYAKEATGIKVNLGMDHEPFTTYFDTTKGTLALTSSPKLFDFDFVMEAASDTNTRIEFNCGTALSDVFIDQVSLTMQYVAPAETGPVYVHRTKPVDSRVYVVPGKPRYGASPRMFGAEQFRGSSMVNLLGRRMGLKRETDRPEYRERSYAAGVYLMHAVRKNRVDNK